MRPGMTTLELDTLAETHIRDHGGIPNFQLVPGYRHTLCTSVNEEIVHGIPGSRVLVEGDLVSIDCGAQVGLWNGDAAISVIVGGPEAGAARRRRARRRHRGVAVGRHHRAAGGREPVCRGRGGRGQPHRAGARRGWEYGIVEDYVGHGIGTSMHMDPQVPNYRVSGKGPKVVDGTTICIEPMVALGDQDNVVLDDEWTVATRDRSRAAHWEHSVAATEAGLCVLTAVDGGEARLRALGAAVRPDRPRLTRPGDHSVCHRSQAGVARCAQRLVRALPAHGTRVEPSEGSTRRTRRSTGPPQVPRAQTPSTPQLPDLAAGFPEQGREDWQASSPPCSTRAAPTTPGSTARRPRPPCAATSRVASRSTPSTCARTATSACPARCRSPAAAPCVTRRPRGTSASCTTTRTPP